MVISAVGWVNLSQLICCTITGGAPLHWALPQSDVDVDPLAFPAVHGEKLSHLKIPLLIAYHMRT
jgi:hypothetical protein